MDKLIFIVFYLAPFNLLLSKNCNILLQKSLSHNIESVLSDKENVLKDNKLYNYLSDGKYKSKVDSLWLVIKHGLEHSFSKEDICDHFYFKEDSFVLNEVGYSNKKSFGVRIYFEFDESKLGQNYSTAINFRFYISSSGELENLYIPLLPSCSNDNCDFNLISESNIINLTRDKFGIKEADEISLERVGLFEFSLSYVDDLTRESKLIIYNIESNSFKDKLPVIDIDNAHLNLLKDYTDNDSLFTLIGKFVSKDINSICRFVADEKINGPNHLNENFLVGISQGLHGVNATLNTRCLVVLEKVKINEFTQQRFLDEKEYFFIRYVEYVDKRIPELYRILDKNKYYNARVTYDFKEDFDLENYKIFDKYRSDDFRGSIRLILSGQSNSLEKNKCLSESHVWIFSDSSRLSIDGKLTFIMKYRNDLIGDYAFKNGKIKFSNKYSFDGIGGDPIVNLALDTKLVKIKIKELDKNTIRITFRPKKNSTWYDLIPFHGRPYWNNYSPLIRILFQNTGLDKRYKDLFTIGYLSNRSRLKVKNFKKNGLVTFKKIKTMNL